MLPMVNTKIPAILKDSQGYLKNKGNKIYKIST